MRFLLVLILFATLLGCRHTQSPEASGLDFTTDRASYAPGADVHLRLGNRTDHLVGYNLCFSALERQAGSGWEAVPPTEGDVCTAIENGLAPGDSASYTKTLQDDLPVGTYRYATEVRYRESRQEETLMTAPFTVR